MVDDDGQWVDPPIARDQIRDRDSTDAAVRVGTDDTPGAAGVRRIGTAETYQNGLDGVRLSHNPEVAGSNSCPPLRELAFNVIFRSPPGQRGTSHVLTPFPRARRPSRRPRCRHSCQHVRLRGQMPPQTMVPTCTPHVRARLVAAPRQGVGGGAIGGASRSSARCRP